MTESLADKIIERQQYEEDSKDKELRFDFFNYELPEKDEYGMPTANSLEYVIARIIYIDYNVSGKERLHLRGDGRIWEGDRWIAENDKTLYRITKWKYKPFTAEQKARIWARLVECLPTLSYDKLVVKDNLIWDWKNNDLYFSDDKPLTMN